MFATDNTYFQKAYISLLALISVSAPLRWSRLVSNHLALLLLALFAVYLYRDVWPLATFNKGPLDSREGWTLWAKIVILGVTSVIIPLFIPRQYIPVNPKEPSEPNAEQTTSIINLALWTFLDPIIWIAYRVPHLKFEQLPPLADYDAGKNLISKSFPELDPFSGGSKNRHLFWGLLSVYRYDYMVLALMMIIKLVCGLASPIGINQLLKYLESNGEKAGVKPWVWIGWLFLAPTIGSLAFQWYIFVAVRICFSAKLFDADYPCALKGKTLVRTEAILTQLVFNHSLRIRVKAEVPEGSAAATPSNEPPASGSGPVTTENTGSEGNVSSNGDDENMEQSSSSSLASGKGKHKSTGAVEPIAATKITSPAKKGARTDNLIGKINNLVTTDLNNITDARNFLYIGMPFSSATILNTRG